MEVNVGDKFVIEIADIVQSENGVSYYHIKGSDSCVPGTTLVNLERVKDSSDPTPEDFMVINFINSNLDKGDEILIRDDEGVNVVSDNIYRAIILMEDPKRVFTVDVYDYAAHDILEMVNLIPLLKDAFCDGKVVSRVRSSVNDHGLVEFHAYNWKYDSGNNNISMI